MKNIFFIVSSIASGFVSSCFGNVPLVALSRRDTLLNQEVPWVQQRMPESCGGIIVNTPVYTFKNKDLRGINFKRLNFCLTDFENANLSGALLTGASFSASTNLRGAVLKNVNFEGIYTNHRIHSPEETKIFFRNAGAIVE